MRRTIVRVALALTALVAGDLLAGGNQAQAQLFGNNYRVRVRPNGVTTVRGRGLAPVVVDPFVTTVASAPVVQTSVVQAPLVTTTRVVESAPLVTTTRVVESAPVVMTAPVASPYVTTTRVLSAPVVTTTPVYTRSYVVPTVPVIQPRVFTTVPVYPY